LRHVPPGSVSAERADRRSGGPGITSHHEIIAIALVLTLGTVLVVLAEWRAWAPSLKVSLLVGTALHASVLVVSARNSWQPPDFNYHFILAGTDVLHHHDPLLRGPRGWNYLPLNAMLFAGQLKVGAWLDIPWVYIGRFVPVLADLGLVVLVSKLAPRQGNLRAFQYAVFPLAILVSADHGQMEPVTLFFAVLAFVLTRRQRYIWAGVALGMAIAATSWPILFLPALCFGIPTVRERVRAGVATVGTAALWFLTMPLSVGTPLNRMHDSLHKMLNYKSIVGEWGWTAWATKFAGAKSAAANGAHWGRIGSLVTVVLIAVAIYLYREAGDLNIAVVTITIFLCTASGFGAQYLTWCLPFVVACGLPRAIGAWLGASVWAAFGYVILTSLPPERWVTWHQSWTLSSIAVIAVLLQALPSRRPAGVEPSEPPVERPQSTSREAVPV
jgi:hypothetical protein